ncbi:HEAT repeat domain-containing protein [Planctomycetota bacterium]
MDWKVCLVLCLAAGGFLVCSTSFARDMTLEESKYIAFFKENFFIEVKTEKDTRQHRDAVYELKRVDHPIAVDMLMKHVFRDKDTIVQYRGVVAMSKYKDPETIEYIKNNALKNRNAVVRALTVEAIAKGKINVLLPQVRALVDDKNNEVRAMVAFAIMRLKPANAVNILIQMLGNETKSDAVRVACLTALKKYKDPRSVGVVAECLKSNIVQIRIAAVYTLKAIRSKKCIGPLIESFQLAKGREKLETLSALEWLTGQYYGMKPEGWAGWWKGAKDKDFKMPTEEEIITEGSIVKPKNTWFGIPLESTRVIFIIDLSKSMSNEIRWEGAGPDGPGSGKPGDRPEGVDSGNDDDDDDKDGPPVKPRRYKGRTKLAIVKEEMAFAIELFDENTFFNIITYNTVDDRVEIRVWKKALTPGTEVNKKNAISWIRNKKAEGRTPIFNAIMKALEMDQDDPSTAGYSEKGADTIFLLSDGEPTDGDETDNDRILVAVKRANRLKQIKIHCVAAGHFDNTLLARLAAQNHGTFVVIGETE